MPLAGEGSNITRAKRGWGNGLLVGACVLLLLTSCRVPGAVHPTVKVGLAAPFEGRYRYVGYDLFPAVRLALREANATGGVEGYYVELVAYDDGADPAMAAEQARKLELDPEVVAVIGHFREETTAAAGPIYGEAGLPLIVVGVLDPSLESDGGATLRLGPDADTVAAALLSAVEGGGLVLDDGPHSEGGDRALGEVLRTSGALAPVVSPDDPSWVDEMLTADPSVIVCSGDPVTAGEVIAALRAAGWQGDFLGGPAMAASDFAAIAGEAAEGAMFVTPWPLPEDAERSGQLEGYTEISAGNAPGPLALPAYDAAQLVLQALEMDLDEDGVPSRVGVTEALGRLEQSLTEGSLTWYRIGPGGVAERIPAPSSP